MNLYILIISRNLSSEIEEQLLFCVVGTIYKKNLNGIMKFQKRRSKQTSFHVFTMQSYPSLIVFIALVVIKYIFIAVDLLLVNANDDAIYMCGNSLGLMPKSTKRLMDEQFEKWANM